MKKTKINFLIMMYESFIIYIKKNFSVNFIYYKSNAIAAVFLALINANISISKILLKEYVNKKCSYYEDYISIFRDSIKIKSQRKPFIWEQIWWSIHQRIHDLDLEKKELDKIKLELISKEEQLNLKEKELFEKYENGYDININDISELNNFNQFWSNFSFIVDPIFLTKCAFCFLLLKFIIFIISVNDYDSSTSIKFFGTTKIIFAFVLYLRLYFKILFFLFYKFEMFIVYHEILTISTLYYVKIFIIVFLFIFNSVIFNMFFWFLEKIPIIFSCTKKAIKYLFVQKNNKNF